MSRILDAILKLESYLARERPDFFNALLPGLTIPEIDSLVSRFPFRLPVEVYDLYQWRNGMGIEVIDNLSFRFYPYSSFFSPLEFCVRDYEMLMEVKDSADLDDEQLNSRWFPLISCNQTFSLSVGHPIQQPTAEILYLWTDAEWAVDPSYESLTAQLLTITECLEEGVYYLDEEGDFQSKPTREEEIHKKYNPSDKYTIRNV